MSHMIETRQAPPDQTPERKADHRRRRRRGGRRGGSRRAGSGRIRRRRRRLEGGSAATRQQEAVVQGHGAVPDRAGRDGEARRRLAVPRTGQSQTGRSLPWIRLYMEANQVTLHQALHGARIGRSPPSTRLHGAVRIHNFLLLFSSSFPSIIKSSGSRWTFTRWKSSFGIISKYTIFWCDRLGSVRPRTNSCPTSCVRPLVGSYSETLELSNQLVGTQAIHGYLKPFHSQEWSISNFILLDPTVWRTRRFIAYSDDRWL